MSKASDKDTILKKLRYSGPMDVTQCIIENEEFHTLFNRYQLGLEQDCYITTIDVPVEDIVIDSKEVDVTRSGQIFLNNGGYVAQRNKVFIDGLWNRGNILVAFCAPLVSYCTYNKTETDTRSQIVQKQTIDSLKQQLAQIDSTIRKINQEITAKQIISR